MKSIKYFAAAIALTAAFTATAAQEVAPSAASNLNKVGVVSASGATTLDGLQAQLAEKAEAAGATSFKISSVTGQNLLNGTATIYN
ncbi:hypothetical protein CIG19_17240 [Enterobacterales bacterium CwR94]|nr:hypothetical protein CIG19_17240 [Enterobacterales bacterium CwR94]